MIRIFNKFLSFIFIFISFVFLYLIIEANFINEKIFNDFSIIFIKSINDLFGIFSYLFIFSGIIIGTILLSPLNQKSKILFILGYLLLFVFLLSFFNWINIPQLYSGKIGEKLSNYFNRSGFFISLSLYFFWFFLSLFLILYPFKNLIFQNYIIPKKNKYNNIRYSNKINFINFRENQNKKNNKKEWFSKVIMEKTNNLNGRNFTSNYNFNKSNINITTNKTGIKNNEEETILFENELKTKTYNYNINLKTNTNNLKKIDTKNYFDNLKLLSEKTSKNYESNINISNINISIEKNIENTINNEINNELNNKIYKLSSDKLPVISNVSMQLDKFIPELEIMNDNYIIVDEIKEQKEEIEKNKNDIKENIKLLDFNNINSINEIEKKITTISTNNNKNNFKEIKEIIEEKINNINTNKSDKIDDNYEEFSNKYDNFIPDADILKNYDKVSSDFYKADEEEAAKILEQTLLEFDIVAHVKEIIHGPVVTLFKLIPAPGIKLSRIESLSNNLALRLAAQSIRIIAPIPGEKFVGIEIPNKKRELVSFKEIVNSVEFSESKYLIPIGLGKDIYGKIIVIDLYRMPHMLIAGATGAGKSVCVNSFISSILFSKSPDDLKLVLIDPKIVELKPYNNIPHLLSPVVTDSKESILALKYLYYEMERRYSLLDEMGVRDIVDYRIQWKKNNKNLENLPFIVCFVDEFADLLTTAGKEAEFLFAKLAAKARAVGILLVLATQRPSADVITGLIKANIPARIAFQVISLQDSRIILDQKGAEKLLGQGDMLYLSPTQPFPIRLQGAFLSKEEVDLIANQWKNIGTPEYVNFKEILGEFDTDEDDSLYFDSENKDPLFDQALEIVYQMGKASASYLQRKLNIGYNRAARIVEEMEEMGIVGPARGAKPREIIGDISNFKSK